MGLVHFSKLDVPKTTQIKNLAHQRHIGNGLKVPLKLNDGIYYLILIFKIYFFLKKKLITQILLLLELIKHIFLSVFQYRIVIVYSENVVNLACLEFVNVRKTCVLYENVCVYYV